MFDIRWKQPATWGKEYCFIKTFLFPVLKSITYVKLIALKIKAKHNLIILMNTNSLINKSIKHKMGYIYNRIWYFATFWSDGCCQLHFVMMY